jgi:hypothetical protein
MIGKNGSEVKGADRIEHSLAELAGENAALRLRIRDLERQLCGKPRWPRPEARRQTTQEVIELGYRR